jgi:hypothetical protein
MKFEIRLNNGARNLIEVKSMTRAKRIATQMLTPAGGNVYVKNLQTGEAWWRCFWQAGDKFGWYHWMRVMEDAE